MISIRDLRVTYGSTTAVVLADEPTGALDTSAGLLAMEALTDLAREQGTCVIVVTHDARIASLCDRDVTLCDGRLVEPSTASSVGGSRP